MKICQVVVYYYNLNYELKDCIRSVWLHKEAAIREAKRGIVNAKRDTHLLGNVYPNVPLSRYKAYEIATNQYSTARRIFFVEEVEVNEEE